MIQKYASIKYVLIVETLIVFIILIQRNRNSINTRRARPGLPLDRPGPAHLEYSLEYFDSALEYFLEL